MKKARRELKSYGLAVVRPDLQLAQFKTFLEKSTCKTATYGIFCNRDDRLYTKCLKQALFRTLRFFSRVY